MIKVRGVMAEGFLLKERPWRAQSQADASPGAKDTVTISEEGKKRHILGQVMASISGPEIKKNG